MKRIIKKFTSAGKTRIGLQAKIDNLFESDRGVVMCGWVLVDGDPSEPALALTDLDGSGVSTRFIWLHRPDVEAALQPDLATTFCSGFVAFADIESRQFGRLHVGSESLDFRKQTYALVNSVDAILAAVPDKANRMVAEALREFGFQIAAVDLGVADDKDNRLSGDSAIEPPGIEPPASADIRVTIDSVYESQSNSIVMSGWVFVDGNATMPDFCFQDHQGRPIETNVIWVPRPDVTAALKSTAAVSYCSGFVAIAIAQVRELDALQLAGAVIDFSSLSFEMSESLSSIIDSLPKGSRERVSEKLEQFGFAEHLPSAENGERELYSLHVDTAAIIADKYAYLNGWIADPGSDIDVIQVVLGGEVVDIRSELIRYPRPDLREMAAAKGMSHAGMGFFCIVPISKAMRSSSIRYGRQMDKGRLKKMSLKFGSLPADEVKATRLLLAPLNVYSESFATRAAPLLARVFEAIWEPRLQSTPVGEVLQYGKRPEAPKTSMIIPIYGRYDFVQHQLLHFSGDKDFANTEIIYVLDDPAKAREFFIACNGAYQTFGQPFTTVYCGRNLGYAGANNLGVEQARGEYLLLLNSDIIPREKGWLSNMLSKFTTLESAGILGGKLVYEDNSIQHIGMQFQEDSFYPGIWMNYHPFKGFPESLAPSFSSQEVESVTGACMLVRTEVYRQVGGFDTHYLLGDFEDSDLCMKVRQQGLKIYADGENCLYHLERQSQNLVDAGDWKFKLTLMNGMRQKQKWDQQIKDLKNEFN